MLLRCRYLLSYFVVKFSCCRLGTKEYKATSNWAPKLIIFLLASSTRSLVPIWQVGVLDNPLRQVLCQTFSPNMAEMLVPHASWHIAEYKYPHLITFLSLPYSWLMPFQSSVSVKTAHAACVLSRISSWSTLHLALGTTVRLDTRPTTQWKIMSNNSISRIIHRRRSSTSVCCGTKRASHTHEVTLHIEIQGYIGSWL